MVNHPAILATYTINRTPKEIVMVIEYCEGGDLRDDVLKKGIKMTIQDLIQNLRLWTC